MKNRSPHPFIYNSHGFTLIELVMMIIIVGIISAIAVTKMSSSLDSARTENTKSEMKALSAAMVGNPDLNTAGKRTDFGYVGDVGSLPPDLDALVENPGFSTWNGPYIERGNDASAFKQDGWGVQYMYSDTLIRSIGSGSNIDKVVIANSALLFSNSVEGYVIDASHSMPGTKFKDSLVLLLTYPNGTGGLTTAVTNPDVRGNFSFNDVPVGNHELSAISIPENDTLHYEITVTPGSTVKMDIIFPDDLW
jgi:prepilin-type N-terminal cleavage/methylation domain-containing protein